MKEAAVPRDQICLLHCISPIAINLSWYHRKKRIKKPPTNHTRHLSRTTLLLKRAIPLLLVQSNRMLHLIHQRLPAITAPTLLPPTTMPTILVLVHVALSATPSMEVLVPFARAHGGLGDHIFRGDGWASGRATLGLERGRVAG